MITPYQNFKTNIGGRKKYRKKPQPGSKLEHVIYVIPWIEVHEWRLEDFYRVQLELWLNGEDGGLGGKGKVLKCWT